MCASSRRPTGYCATEVAAGRFRGDLYFRLNVIPVRIPPLRERPQDILPLARHFLAYYSAEAGRPLRLAPEAERLLVAYPWHGNVRELENVIERAVVMSGAEMLTPDAFALESCNRGTDLRLPVSVGNPLGTDEPSQVKRESAGISRSGHDFENQSHTR